MASGLSDCVRCLLLGVRDSLAGTLLVVRFVRRSEQIRRQLLQCFLLNGVILWLSVLIFEYVLLPLIQYTASFVYGVISDPSQSGALDWLGTILWYMFTGLWVLPVFWISKPINSIWFQDIASAAYQETKKQTGKQHSRTKKTSSLSISQSVSRFIADLLFSVVMEVLFLIQAMVVGVVPGVGGALSLLHMAMLYALYSFEYKWMYEGYEVHLRVNFIEKNWPYFLGFGLPLSIMTALPSSSVVSACIFAVAFPVFILSAYEAKPAPCNIAQIPVFNVVRLISNAIFNRSGPTPLSRH